MNYKVSVVVSVYNISEYLDKCIKSICDQHYKNIQIILVDDGSTDNCLDIIRKWRYSDSRIVVVSKSNNGLVSAKKIGVRISESDFCTFVDGDDWIDPDWIDGLINGISDDTIDMVCAGNKMDYPDGTTQIKYNRFNEGIYEVEDIIPQMIYGKNDDEFSLTQYTCTKLFKTSLLKKIIEDIPEDISTGEDVALTLSYILASKKINIINAVGYHYIQRLDSMCAKLSDKEKIHCLNLIKYLGNITRNSKYDDILKPQLEWYKKMLMLTRAIDYFDNGKETVLSALGGVKPPCKVVIYGAGAMGKCIFRYLRNNKDIQICGWLDKSKKIVPNVDISIDDPETYDYSLDQNMRYIVAVINKKSISEIINILISKGISTESILSVSDNMTI